MSAHIFIDAENIKPEIGLKAVEKFSSEYSVDGVNIIGKEDTISSKYKEAGEIYNFQNCYYGKNSADTWLCTEIAKTIFAEPEVEVIIIVSSDRDFLPAIKLATEQNKKVILVSDGSGHKNLKALLYDLRINPDLIELVDFRNDLTIPVNQSIKKKGINESMENVPSSNKLMEVCAPLSQSMQTFFIRRKSQVKFIFVKNGDKLFEIPFIDGINSATFRNTLMDLKIIRKAEQAAKVIADSFLKQVNDKIFLEDMNTEKSFDAVIDYFVKHSEETKTIFIKQGDKLNEVPFVSGMPLEIFSELLSSYGISNDLSKVTRIINESFLDLREGKIYFRSEENLTVEQSKPDKSKIISIAHNGVVHYVPFVEGVKLSEFARMLREKNIIGKNASSSKVLAANGFKIVNNQVYKNHK